MEARRPASRGSYAKGVAKREEILERALDVVAREGYRGASVKEIADAVGLSQAGLLHYFESKEELFTEILRKRDELDVVHAGFLVDAKGHPLRPDEIDLDELHRGYVGAIRHNTEVPGLVQLFARLAVDAADPEHPAHHYFVERGAALRDVFVSALAHHQAAGRITDRVDADTIARLLQAAADGLHVQWMLEPDLDMAAAMEALFELLHPRPQERNADT